MLSFTQGNLLTSNAEALVNTVNTVGIMGKGIALMFKENFPENFKIYEEACKRGEVRVGRMLVTERQDMYGFPRWIINFPTKQHWRSPSQIEWIEEGLDDLVRVIREHNIKSVAIPPLGSGNGGLNWKDVRPKIEAALSALANVEIIVYEPTAMYQNVAKRTGVEKLTPARALIAELVRRYWVLGIECTILEIQKLAYFLERSIDEFQLKNPLDLQFSANKFGPYSRRLSHLLNALDGSYLQCEKRLADASALDVIRFDDKKRDRVAAYLNSGEAKVYMPALDATEGVIDGFQSPLGMELLATVDWLLLRTGTAPNVEAIRTALNTWPGGAESAERKMKLFDDRLLGLALDRLAGGS
jgi:O-acetyl-ADP-ribose deacetylase (regulator of RNase III)